MSLFFLPHIFCIISTVSYLTVFLTSTLGHIINNPFILSPCVLSPFSCLTFPLVWSLSPNPWVISFITYIYSYDPLFIYSYVSKFLCSHIPMFLCSYVPIFLCSYVPMILYSFFHIFLGSNILLLLFSYNPIFVCSYVPMFLWSYVPIFL